MAKVAKQSEFDFLVQEALGQNGHEWLEAVLEAREILEEGEYDLSLLVQYTSKEQFDKKTELEKRVKTLVKASTLLGNIVEGYFALQVLLPPLVENDGTLSSEAKMIIKLAEQNQMVPSLWQLLAGIGAEEEEDEDSDEEDDEEDRNLKVKGFSELLLALLKQPQSVWFQPESILTAITEEIAPGLVALVEKQCESPESLVPFFEALTIGLQNAEVLESVKEATDSELADAVALSMKMNKNEVELQNAANALLAVLQA